MALAVKEASTWLDVHMDHNSVNILIHDQLFLSSSWNAASFNKCCNDHQWNVELI